MWLNPPHLDLHMHLDYYINTIVLLLLAISFSTHYAALGNHQRTIQRRGMSSVHHLFGLGTSAQ